MDEFEYYMLHIQRVTNHEIRVTFLQLSEIYSRENLRIDFPAKIENILQWQPNQGRQRVENLISIHK